MFRHVVLLGDSIFDNGSYTGGAPDVLGHLRSILASSWRATLVAVDGSTTATLAAQVARVPSDATDLVISLGGNDALANSDALNLPVSSTAEALLLLADRVERFESAYRTAIRLATAGGRPTTVCTIYDGKLEDPLEARAARVALALFNDAIIRTALELRLGLIDLRLVCTEPADYANPIEPSGQGGRKIAQAIARSLGATAGGS